MIAPFRIALFATEFKLFFHKERLQLIWYQTNQGILYGWRAIYDCIKINDFLNGIVLKEEPCCKFMLEHGIQNRFRRSTKTSSIFFR